MGLMLRSNYAEKQGVGATKFFFANHENPNPQGMASIHRTPSTPAPPPTCSTGAKGATKRGLRAGLRGIRKGYQFFFSQIIKFLIRGVGPTPMVCALGYLNCLPKKPPFLTIFKNFIYWHIQVIFHNGLEKINTNQCFPKNCLFHAISKILNNRPYLWFYFLNL